MSVTEPMVLHFEDSGNWSSLPVWAEYFINIGRQIVLSPKTESRMVTALIVPTRAYAAVFISLGVVVSEAALMNSDSPLVHFENLLGLPPGSPVIYRPGKGKVLKGLILRQEEGDGKTIRVQVNSKAGGGLTHLIKESHAHQVQPAGGGVVKLPKDQKPNKKRIANTFVDLLLGENDPVQLRLKSKGVCALVGHKKPLDQEIRKTPFSVLVNGESYVKGNIQDILRLNEFVTPQQSHRSILIPIGSNPPSPDLVSGVEFGVVFDGAKGFLKWGNIWQKQHLVIVLDRTETHFDEAIAAINTRFSQNRIKGEVEIPKEDPPSGTEVLAFLEKIV